MIHPYIPHDPGHHMGRGCQKAINFYHGFAGQLDSMQITVELRKKFFTQFSQEV